MPVRCPNENGRHVEPVAVPYVTPNFGGWFEKCPCGYVFDRHQPEMMENRIANCDRVVVIEDYPIREKWRGCWTAAECDCELE